MSLRLQAETDLGMIIEDDVAGFGWALEVTSPAGVTLPFTGTSGDIGETIDPETGVAVSGRHAHVTIRLSSLYAAGFTIPESIPAAASLPWVVVFDDINGNSHSYKVIDSKPDRTLGIVALVLEVFG